MTLLAVPSFSLQYIKFDRFLLTKVFPTLKTSLFQIRFQFEETAHSRHCYPSGSAFNTNVVSLPSYNSFDTLPCKVENLLDRLKYLILAYLAQDRFKVLLTIRKSTPSWLLRPMHPISNQILFIEFLFQINMCRPMGIKFVVGLCSKSLSTGQYYHYKGHVKICSIILFIGLHTLYAFSQGIK